MRSFESLPRSQDIAVISRPASRCFQWQANSSSLQFLSLAVPYKSVQELMTSVLSSELLQLHQELFTNSQKVHRSRISSFASLLVMLLSPCFPSQKFGLSRQIILSSRLYKQASLAISVVFESLNLVSTSSTSLLGIGQPRLQQQRLEVGQSGSLTLASIKSRRSSLRSFLVLGF